MFSPLQNAIVFSTHTVISIYTSIVLIRATLQLSRMQPYNPFDRLINQLTAFLFKPVARVLRKDYQILLYAVLIAILLQMLESVVYLLVKGFSISGVTDLGGFFFISLDKVLESYCSLFTVLIIIQVIASYLPAPQLAAASDFLNRLTMPLYRPIASIIPNLGGIDISPMILIFILSLIKFSFVGYFSAIGRGLL